LILLVLVSTVNAYNPDDTENYIYNILQKHRELTNITLDRNFTEKMIYEKRLEKENLLEVSAQPKTITVCKSGCNFSSIQAAIDNSSSGDTIRITDKATYYEQVGISKDNITLDCDGATLNGSDLSGTGIYIEDKIYNTIKNCNIINYEYGLNFFQSGENKVINNTFLGNHVAIYMSLYGYNLIENNTIKNNSWSVYTGVSNSDIYSNNIFLNNTNGMYLKYASGTTKIINNVFDGNEIFFDTYIHANIMNNKISNSFGLIFYCSQPPCGNTNVTNNTIYSNEFGIYIYNIHPPYGIANIKNNTIFLNGDGLDIIDSSGAVLKYNKIDNNTLNLFVKSNEINNYNNSIDETNIINEHPVKYYFKNCPSLIENNIMTHLTLIGCNNSIVRNNIFYGDGIRLVYVNNSEIFSNFITDNYFGFYLTNSTNNTIRNNKISNNVIGLRLMSSRNNRIFNNTIINNLYGISLKEYNSNNKIEFNDIYDNSFFNIINNQTYLVHAENNWWGTTNETEINKSIYDYYDKPSLGIVYFRPWLSEPKELIESITVFPSVRYNQISKILEISAYAYNIETGNEIKSAYATYSLYNNSSFISFGQLSYDDNLKWNNAFSISLVPGTYYVNVSINGFTETTSFSVVPDQATIYGYVIDDEGYVSGATVKLYRTTDFWSGKSPVAINISENDGFYSFFASPGSYTIFANKTGYVDTSTLSFNVIGGEEIAKWIILSKQIQLINLYGDMESLKNSLSHLRDFETELMANISAMAHEDLPKSNTSEDVLEIVGDVLLNIGQEKPEDAIIEVAQKLTEDVIRKSLHDTLYANAFLNTSYLAMYDGFSRGYINKDDYSKTVNFIIEDIPVRNKTELENTSVYAKSRDKLEEIQSSILHSWNYSTSPDFDENKANQVIAWQIYQIDRIVNSVSSVIIPANPYSEPMIIGMRPVYGSYKFSSDFIRSIGIIKDVVNMIGEFSEEISSFTSITGFGAVFYSISIATKLINCALTVASIPAQSEAAKNFAMASITWTNDMIKTPIVYSETKLFFENESLLPYYLNKSNTFSTSIESVDLNPYMTKDNKNYILTENMLLGIAENNATVVVKNTGMPSVVRVLAESIKSSGYKEEYSVGFSYFNTTMKSKETITKDMKYSGFFVMPSDLLNPHILLIYSLNGPFVTNLTESYYYVISPIVAAALNSSIFLHSGYNLKLSDNDVMELKLQARTDKKQLTVKDYILLTDTVSNNDTDYYLSPENSNISFLYNVSNDTYALEVQLFYPPGYDVDLHVYNENRTVGYNYITGQNDIEFPATYNGKDYIPESIYIPAATNKTYKIEARLVRIDSNISVPINIQILKEPPRPAIIAATPNYIIQNAMVNENILLYLLIGEAGRQKPLHNVSVYLNIPGLNLLKSSAFYDLIPAGTSKGIEFIVVANTSGSYNGFIAINSSAGDLYINVSLSVYESMLNVSANSFDGSTTNFSAYHPPKFEIIFERTMYGKIKFNDNISLSPFKFYDFDKYVNISYNLIALDSNNLSEFNRSATLWLYNLSFSSPKILRNGDNCPPSICKIISYINGTLVFNVTGFTTYQATEGGIPGDVNGDCKVNIFDLAAVGICYGQAPVNQCKNADVNNDGSINIFDLATVGINYGKVC